MTNLLTILSALHGEPVADCEAATPGQGYGDLKKRRGRGGLEFAAPFRERRASYLDDPAELDAVLAAGAERARAVAAGDARAGLRPGRLPAGGTRGRQ